MANEKILHIQSRDELSDSISKTPLCILFCTVEGRDAVNASAQEEFECAAERYSTSERTFVKIAGDTFKDALRDAGVDMGETPYPKFAILANGEVRIAEDVVDVDLPVEISKVKG